ncbi:MAG: rRNA pseudouridine synthase [Ignavibacteriales bacterium]|nr:rRNA pseudouridine synthase [Ignavibacteriales bacterium]
MKSKSKTNKVSLARVLSKLGYSSRSQAEEMILQGKVSVNDVIINNPAYRCEISIDKISVDGRNLQKKSFIYIIMNKPLDVITTRSDEKKRKTVYDIIGKIDSWIFPVGRLDKDTTGLILLTNDNGLGERLTNPISKIPKTYYVKVDKPISENDINALENGIMIGEEMFLPSKVKVINKYEIELTIIEGKNRQVRRMLEALGYEIISLSRTAIGKLTLPRLKTGEWRYLTKKEIELIKSKIPNSKS